MWHNQFIFDVDRARAITQDGRKPVLLDRPDVRYAVDSSVITEKHVPHVDVRFPGIMARVRCSRPDGSSVVGDVLIDGHHRAARCLQLRRKFLVYVLSTAESDEILTRRPDKAYRRRAAKARPVAKAARSNTGTRRTKRRTRAH